MSRFVVLPPVQQLSACGGRAVLFSARSPIKQTPNEDVAAVIPCTERSGALVVADGLGGMRTGELAARLAVREICEAIQQRAAACGPLPPVVVGPETPYESWPLNVSGAVPESSGNGEDVRVLIPGAPPANNGERSGESAAPLRASILDGIEAANARIQSEAAGSATTLAVVEIRDAEIRPYHVGDSLVLVCGQKGKLKLQTVSHSPVGFAVEAGLIDAREAMHHQERHLVSNVVGHAEMRIEVGPSRKLNPRDTVLLASDGLADNLHVDEIVECIRKGPLDEAVANLARDATERMIRARGDHPSKPDDLTIIAFRPESAGR